MPNAVAPQPRTPESVHELFEAFVNEGNLERILHLYEPRAALVQRTGRVVSGAGAIRESLRSLLSIKPKMRIQRLSTIDAADVAVLISDWQVTGMAPDGSTVSEAGRTYDIVRRQANGTWRVVVDNPFGVMLPKKGGNSDQKPQIGEGRP